MATVRRNVPVPPETVFAVLADPDSYEHWVVGARKIRGVDGDWPERGAKLHHSFGPFPFVVRDTTSVVDVMPGERLVLRARARPFGVACVDVRLQPIEEGTCIEMDEWVEEPSLLRPLQPVLDPLVALRNNRALARLARLAEQRFSPSGVPEVTR